MESFALVKIRATVETGPMLLPEDSIDKALEELRRNLKNLGLAVLSIDPSGLTLHPLALGSSAALGIGDQVAAIGDPFTYERSLSTGVVSGLDRTISAPKTVGIRIRLTDSLCVVPLRCRIIW